MWAKYEAFIYSDLSMYSGVSQTFLLADAFCLRKITTNYRILAHVHIIWAHDRFSELKITISEQILDRYSYI
jgi:hypothetical protein